MERVWGGRRLESLFGKRLPQSARIGEAWEIVDREEAQSVVHEGPLRGSTLHELWMEHREAIFGTSLPDTPRFPILCKLLDAQERLSLQVHPPAAVAQVLGGEPKTEMWYVVDALLDSDLYAGVVPGVTRESFEEAIREGRVADQIYKVPVKKGDAIFIPSGRVHAIGAGNLIVEVQQNSDTTYRVFDWNRIGVDGKMRALQVAESLKSINFDDVEPAFTDVSSQELLVACEYFQVERWRLSVPRNMECGDRFAIFTVVEGAVECAGHTFTPGSFFLAPPVMAYHDLKPVTEEATVLRTTIPR